jgi:hypothetical protein
MNTLLTLSETEMACKTCTSAADISCINCGIFACKRCVNKPQHVCYHSYYTFPELSNCTRDATGSYCSRNHTWIDKETLSLYIPKLTTDPDELMSGMLEAELAGERKIATLCKKLLIKLSIIKTGAEWCKPTLN